MIISVQVVERQRVKAIYLAPTAIRDMMAHGNEPATRHSRASLEVRTPAMHATHAPHTPAFRYEPGLFTCV